MNDNDIIKALERCVDADALCTECPYDKKKVDYCSDALKDDALSLINRQKVEIERWKQFASDTGMEVLIERAAKERLKSELENARAEAIKEFEDRILEKAMETGSYFAVKSIIASVKKELVGERE